MSSGNQGVTGYTGTSGQLGYDGPTGTTGEYIQTYTGTTGYSSTYTGPTGIFGATGLTGFSFTGTTGPSYNIISNTGLVFLRTITMSATTSVYSIFSSTYDCYKLVGTQVTNGNNDFTNMRLISGTSVDSSSVYCYSTNIGVNLGTGGGTSTTAVNTNRWVFDDGTQTATSNCGFVIEYQNPYLAKPTTMEYRMIKQKAGTPVCYYGTGLHTSSTSFDGFQIYAGALSGYLTIYGYNKS